MTSKELRALLVTVRSVLRTAFWEGENSEEMMLDPEKYLTRQRVIKRNMDDLTKAIGDIDRATAK